VLSPAKRAESGRYFQKGLALMGPLSCWERGKRGVPTTAEKVLFALMVGILEQTGEEG
jgi:hypothetical protein